MKLARKNQHDTLNNHLSFTLVLKPFHKSANGTVLYYILKMQSLYNANLFMLSQKKADKGRPCY